MNSLRDLRDVIVRNPLVVVNSFNGFELYTNIGFFQLDQHGYYKDGKLLSNKELKEAINGKPQTSPTKERTKWLPVVQATQTERMQASRKSERPKANRKSERSSQDGIERGSEVNRKVSRGNRDRDTNLKVLVATKISTKKKRSRS